MSVFIFCFIDNDLLIRGGGPYHVENSILICKGNQWIGFYLTVTYIMKQLNMKMRANRRYLTL